MSQIATSIEQSTRLLEAGVPKESADMRWEQFAGCIPHLCYQQDLMPLIAPRTTPAWSLSALWDLLSESNITLEYATNRSSEALIESIVTAVERFAKQGRM